VALQCENARLRARMERAVQRLIDALDAMDADEDLEPSGDELEPMLGATEGVFGWLEDRGNKITADELEAISEDGGDVCATCLMMPKPPNQISAA
jgi:hypothetical protein